MLARSCRFIERFVLGVVWEISELTLGLNVGAIYEGEEEGGIMGKEELERVVGKETQGKRDDGIEYQWIIRRVVEDDVIVVNMKRRKG